MDQAEKEGKAGAATGLEHSLLDVAGGLREVRGAAEVAPVVFVGAEGEDFLAQGGEAKIGVDDGEDAFFSEQGEEAGGDDVDAGEGQGEWRVANGEWRVGGKSGLLAWLGMTTSGVTGMRRCAAGKRRGIPRCARNDAPL